MTTASPKGEQWNGEDGATWVRDAERYDLGLDLDVAGGLEQAGISRATSRVVLAVESGRELADEARSV